MRLTNIDNFSHTGIALLRLASGAAVGRSFDVRVPHLGPRHTARALRAMGVQAAANRCESLCHPSQTLTLNPGKPETLGPILNLKPQR